MSWILLAVIGHMANAAAFIIDKSLLASTWKQSATYAALIGGMSAIVVLASPWVETWPHGQALASSVVFGGFFVFAIWSFFEALRRGEASRVVPIVGSLVPLFTLCGTVMLLGEQVHSRMALGFACLLLATWMLSRGSDRGRLDVATIGIASLSAFCFAVASVAGKDAFAHASFLAVLVTSRAVTGFVALGVGLAVPGARRELQSMGSRSDNKKSARSSLGLTIVGQGSGALGFVLVNAALAQGSAALVNALQAVQYAAIVLVAWIGGARLQRILKEDVSSTVLIKKSLAIGLVGIGLWLITT